MTRRLEKHYRLSGVEDFTRPPRFRFRAILGSLAAFVVLCLLHYPLLRLPYYWDEAGYYIPAALDFYSSGQLVPSSTLPTGHTPLVIIYLALAWRAFGLSPLVTRTAMIVFAACTLTGVYALGRRVANREITCWSVLLLALSPLFFAQSVLAHLDLAAGLFTLLALLALLDERPWRFALASTCAVLSKETAVVLLPVAWIFSWWQHRRAARSLPRAWWVVYLAPLVVLVAWVGFYHQATGFWTGNHEYLRYNLYSTLNPVRMFLTLLRRLYETFVGGFNWLLTAGAIAGIGWAQRNRTDTPQGKSRPFACHSERSEESRSAQVSDGKTTLPAQATASTASNTMLKNPPRLSFRGAAGDEESRKSLVPRERFLVSLGMTMFTKVFQHPAKESVQNRERSNILRRFIFLGGWLTTAYLVMLSMVGGAVLPRYLLPIFPPLVLIAVILIWRLPRPAARSIMVFTAGCFVWAWFLNPPYPFPFEDNLAYADFIRLHEQGAQFLEAQPGNRRILTAWPASDELARPILGYVRQPLNVVALGGFGRHEFHSLSPESFDCLYLYSRRWEPSNNWLRSFPWLQRLQQRYFEYQPQIPEQELVERYHLRLLASFERQRQWVRIYLRAEE